MHSLYPCGKFQLFKSVCCLLYSRPKCTQTSLLCSCAMPPTQNLTETLPEKKLKGSNISKSQLNCQVPPYICDIKQEKTKEELLEQVRFWVPGIFRLIEPWTMPALLHTKPPTWQNKTTLKMRVLPTMLGLVAALQYKPYPEHTHRHGCKHHLWRNSFNMTGTNSTLIILSPQTN